MPSADWGEQLLSVVATQVIRHLFTASDRVEVRVECTPQIKLLQGQVDRFQMSGSGLVIRHAFRTEAMEFETDAVSIDFAGLLQGRLLLRQPTQAIAKVVLLEEDINRAFTAPLVVQHLENLPLQDWQDLPGSGLAKAESVSFQSIQVRLLASNRIALSAQACFGADQPVPIALQATLGIERRRRLRFLNCQFDPDGLPDRAALGEAAIALAASASERLGKVLDQLVDLDRFNLDGVTLRINTIETRGQQLVFSGWAQVNHVPETTTPGLVA
ncbi:MULTISPECIES: DUF2993 domain-containing protein [unclassified Limnothrix]|uniref:LmeA family phospholipid-binding protein n=1 Tax=unclassified Limnothrix TaxID=2632864 RepID=UPI001F54A071|nr:MULTISPECIES: DUF2993 domain-containing protein [unclassified Limnothrix]